VQCKWKNALNQLPWELPIQNGSIYKWLIIKWLVHRERVTSKLILQRRESNVSHIFDFLSRISRLSRLFSHPTLLLTYRRHAVFLGLYIAAWTKWEINKSDSSYGIVVYVLGVDRVSFARGKKILTLPVLVTHFISTHVTTVFLLFWKNSTNTLDACIHKS